MRTYRIKRIKPRGAYLVFVLFGAGLIRGRGSFEARASALQMRWQVLSCNEKGKRTREVVIVVPSKFVAYTTEQRLLNILESELQKKRPKYMHLELKNVAKHCNKFPVLTQNLTLCSFTSSF